MKKSNETPERLLIHQDGELAKFNKKTLDEIFSEVKSMKALFTDLGIPFNREAFIKTMIDGSTWLFDILYQQATEMFKKMSDLVKASMVDKDKLHEHISPIEPIIANIKELLNKVNLQVDQVPFDEKDNPVINDTLKEIFSEASKRYVIGTNEIELYHVIEEFILSCNKLEKSLAKNGFPLLFTKYLNFDFPMPNAESDTFAYPLCLANYNNVLNDGHAELEINPEYFEDIRMNLKAISDRQTLEKDFRSLPSEISSYKNRTSEIPAASFKLKPDSGKQVEAGIKTPNKDRWKGMSGI